MPSLFNLLMAVAFATTSDCLIHFAAIPDQVSAPVELVEKTYHRLFDEVGGEKLTPDDLAKMIETGNPYALPESDRDTFSLQQKIRQFEQMLKDKSWHTPSTRSLLVGVLRRRLAGEKRAEEKQNVANERARPDYDIPYVVAFDPPFETHGAIAFSPDTRWVLLPDHPNENSLSVFDTKTRTSQAYARPLRLGHHPYFLPDRPELFFTYKGGSGTAAVPFTDGVPLFAKTKEVSAPEPITTSPPERLSPSSTPGIYFGPFHEGKVLRVNLDTGQRTWIPIPEGFAGKADNGPVPHQNRYFFLDQFQNQHRLYMTTYDAEGKFTTEGQFRTQGTQHGPIRFSSDGNTIICTGEGFGSTVQAGPTKGNDALKPIKSIDGTDSFAGRVIRVIPLEGKNEAFVISEVRDETRSRIELVDLGLLRSVSWFDVPHLVRGNPIISPDGRTLIYSGALQKHLRVLNLDQRLSP